MIAQVPLPRQQSMTGFYARLYREEAPTEARTVATAVVRAKDGDRDALRFLYERYSHNVYGYVRSIVHDDFEAEDVTQQVFAKLMCVLVKDDDRGVPFFAWLLRLARNVAIDHVPRPARNARRGGLRRRSAGRPERGGPLPLPARRAGHAA